MELPATAIFADVIDEGAASVLESGGDHLAYRKGKLLGADRLEGAARRGKSKRGIGGERIQRRFQRAQLVPLPQVEAAPDDQKEPGQGKGTFDEGRSVSAVVFRKMSPPEPIMILLYDGSQEKSTGPAAAKEEKTKTGPTEGPVLKIG